VHSFKVIHADTGDEFAACNAQMLLGGPRWPNAADVPQNMRCRRAACARAYDGAIPDQSIGGGE